MVYVLVLLLFDFYYFFFLSVFWFGVTLSFVKKFFSLLLQWKGWLFVPYCWLLQIQVLARRWALNEFKNSCKIKASLKHITISNTDYFYPKRTNFIIHKIHSLIFHIILKLIFSAASAQSESSRFITTPQSQTVIEGDPIVFTCRASSADGLHYAWLHNSE